MKTETSVEHFTTRHEAIERMRILMRAARRAGNMGAVYAVVPGPDGGWSVVDIGTAIDLGLGYEWDVVARRIEALEKAIAIEIESVKPK